MAKKFLFMTTVLVLVFGLVLSACSSGGKDEASETTAPEAKGNESESKGKPIELVITYGANMPTGIGDLSDVITQREKDIESGEHEDFKNPGNMYQLKSAKYIDEALAKEGINLTIVDWGWDVPLIQKQTAAFVAKEGADIMTGEIQMPGFAAQGLLEPFPDDLAKKVRETIVEGAWKAMEFNGKIYGVTSTTGIDNLYWNKSILKKAGLDPDKIPATWEEWLSNAKKITEAGKGEYHAGGFYAGPNGGGWLRFGPLMLINGGDFVDANNAPTFNSQANIEAFEFLRELAKQNPKGLLASPTENPVREGFDKQNLAYMLDGPWQAQACKDMGKECGMAPIPLSPNGKPGNILIGAQIWSVPTYSKNKEAAFKYIELVTSKENQQFVAEAKGMPPLYKEIAESEEYKSSSPDLYNVYESLKGNVKGLPTFNKENTKTWEVFSNAMVEAQITDKPIKDILDDAQAKALKLQE